MTTPLPSSNKPCSWLPAGTGTPGMALSIGFAEDNLPGTVAQPTNRTEMISMNSFCKQFTW
jgi:hypothetical protein